MEDERIEAHVFLCFLALLLVPIGERKIGQSWERIRAVLDCIHLGEFESKDGMYSARN